MAQSDQVVQNATFPTVRADINDNLAALYSQSSGNSAPAVTVAFQPWIDTSSSPPVKKVRNGSNTAWITESILDPAGIVTAIANGGTGATTATAALLALLPSQSGNAGKALVTSGSAASWGTVASGASVQVFTASGTYTPASGKTTFLVFATGGGGGSYGSSTAASVGAASAGTALRLYSLSELGSSASITVGAGGTGGAAGGGAGGSGGSTVFTPTGTGLTITGSGGSPTTKGGVINSQIDISGNTGAIFAGPGGCSFWAGGNGAGGKGQLATNLTGNTGIAGVVLILEW
jgi:hypothetical protein